MRARTPMCVCVCMSALVSMCVRVCGVCGGWGGGGRGQPESGENNGEEISIVKIYYQSHAVECVQSLIGL